MTCPICRNGTKEAGFITVTLERGSTILVFKNVPAQICDNCGEEFLSAENNRTLLRRAEEEIARGVEVELLQFAA